MTYIKSRKHTPTAIAAGLALSLPLSVLAQTAGQPAATAPAAGATLRGVDVVGSDNPVKPTQLSSPKFTQPLVDTTQTITVIPQEIIKQQQATTLTEAMRNVPGAGTFFAGENGSTSMGDAIFMRGINTSNSIYVDGIRDTSQVYRDMFNVDQVEVIKGPSGSDFGRSAPSGSINIVTKKPVLDNTFDASISGATNNYARGAIDWNHALSDTSAFRLNVMGHSADVAGRDEVHNQRWGVAPSLAFGLNTPTTIYLDFVHVQQSNVPDSLVPTIGLPGFRGYPAAPQLGAAPPVNSSNFYGTQADHDISTTNMMTMRIDHKISPDTTIHNTTRWGQTTQDYLVTAFMFAPNGTPSLFFGADPYNYSQWLMNRSMNLRDSVNEIITNQTNLTTRFDTGSVKHTVSAGLELIREEQTLYNHTASAPQVSVYYPNSDVYATETGRINSNKGQTDTIALYAFDTVDLTSRWQVNGGIRYDHYDTRYNGFASATAAAATNLAKSGGLLTYKIGTLYRVAPNGNVYFNFGVAQQPPGGANFSLASASGPEGAQSVAPAKTKTYELGTKWEVFSKNLLASAALFRTEISNQVVALDDGTSYGSIGKQVIQGIELGATGKITPHWTVMAGYAYQHASIASGTAVAADGSNLMTYTPANALSLWSSYNLPHGFTVGGGVRYVGGLQKGTDGAVVTPVNTAPYWVADLMGSYRVNRNLSLQLNIYNLFDKSYVAAINKSGYRYTPGLPRTAMLTANFSF